MLTTEALIQKYNQPVPRYTSYPTVPYWDGLEVSDWRRIFREQFRNHNPQKGISLYIHLPFCETLCTYCACNKRITTNHHVEGEYIEAVLAEWKLYTDMMEEKPVIRELHLGGGTPTFFSAKNLAYLLESILRDSIVHPDPAFSIEGHPNNTTPEQLSVLYGLGFRRVSFGVQDNDPVVQKAINRIQPIANVQRVTEEARKIGYTSVNYDLVYGLPFQTLDSEKRTMEAMIPLRPDRIAFYSYAHVPWKMKVQRLFDEKDLPSPGLKTALYLLGRQMLGDAGYHDIGMDHFALTGDELYQAFLNKDLHRNFMGYTTQHTDFLLGLGVSSISDIGAAYAQNHRELELYYRSVQNGELAVSKGYILNGTDQICKRYILDIACKGKTTLQEAHMNLLHAFTLPKLAELEQDGLLTIRGSEINVSGRGRQFIRVICQAFDLKWLENQENTPEKMFSKSI
jgi:oxygen-independent coproporphyrinogen-3 oxidase